MRLLLVFHLILLISLIELGFGVDVPCALDNNSIFERYLNLKGINKSISNIYINESSISLLEIGRKSKNNDHGRYIEIKDIEKLIDERVELNNTYIRDGAILMIYKYPGERTLGQVLAIYGYLKNESIMISNLNPSSNSILSSKYANETLRLCKEANCSGVGGCYDIPILMSALLESIGISTRIVLAFNESIEHAYIEVYLGNLSTDESQIKEMVKLISTKYNKDKVYAHFDTESSDIWLNFDLLSNNPGGRFFEAEEHVVIRNPDMPKKFFPNIDDSYSWKNNGDSLYILGKYEQAIASYEKAIRIDPDYEKAWYNKGLSLKNLGRYNESIDCFNKTIKINKDSWESFYNIGFILKELGKYDDAIKNFDNALAINPNSTKTLIGKSSVLVELGEFESAIIFLQKAQEIHPEDGSIWEKIGDILAELSRFPDAIKAYDKSESLDPSNRAILNKKGLAFYRLFRYEDAIIYFDKSIELNPLDEYAWTVKADSLYQLGRFEEAIGCYDRAIKINPSHPYNLYHKALALKALNRDDESEETYAKAMKLE
jgi:tetratricopeptide (TPR) repeat protein